MTRQTEAMRKSILILENDPEIKTILKDKLENCGFDVHCPVDSYVALEHAQNNVLDLIVLNDDMPIINGEDTLQILRQQNVDIPAILFLSKLKTAQDFSHFKACVCMHKPFKIDLLISEVHHLLNT
jgi:DNA-binding response OmpR family regulator